jgi:hypothetical protein
MSFFKNLSATLMKLFSPLDCARSNQYVSFKGVELGDE